MKFKLARANSFKRSFKKIKLTDDEELETKYKDHQLKGNLKEFRECHIKPDLLFMYRINDDVLELVDIGTHNELFK